MKDTVITPDRRMPPPVTGFPDLSLPPFREYRLDNGIRMKVLDSGEEEVCRIALMWPQGVLDTDSPEAVGLMVNLLAEGCAGMSGKEINDLLEENGAWLRTTSALHSTLLVMQTLNSAAPRVLPVLASVIGDATFPEESFLSLRNKTASEKEMATRKPAYQATVLARRGFYGPGHPMAREITAESIGATSREAVIEVYDAILRAVPPVVFVSGRVSGELLETLSASLERIPFGTGKGERRVIMPPALSENLILTKDMPDSLQTGVRIQIPTVSPDHPDYEALRVAVAALGGYFGSRLMSNIREDKGYTYGISAVLTDLPEGSCVVIACECDNAYSRAVLEETDREIGRLASVPPGEEEMETVRNVLISSMAGILDSPFYISGYAELMESNGLPSGRFSRQFREIISMTPERVAYAAARYIRDARRVVALAGGKPG